MDFDTVPILEAFRVLSIIEKAYVSLILHSNLNISPRLRSEIERKFSDTVRITGFSMLANGVIEASTGSNIINSSQKLAEVLSPRKTEGSLLKNSNLMQMLLQLHILNPKDRFSATSKDMRNTLRILCKYCSAANALLIEHLWRGLMVDTAMEACSNVMASAAGINSAELVHRTEVLLNTLIKLLSDLRYISRMDMAVTKNCYMSADLAFQTAYRR